MGSPENGRGGWSLQLGNAMGIPIRVHFTFLLLLVWFGVVSRRNGDDILLALAFLVLVFGCVVLHELGHAAMARRFGVRTRDIVLYPIGGIARLERIPAGRAELLIALAGPAVNLALAFALLALLASTPLPLTFRGPIEQPAELLPRLLLLNVVLFVFNLLPAFPMDGGRVLRATLALALSQETATRIATRVGQVVSVLFGLAGVVSGNVFLILIALFVFLGASQEARFWRQRGLLRTATARDAMTGPLEILAPQDALATIAERLMAVRQEWYPVVDAWNRLAGVAPHAELLAALAQDGPATTVLEVMTRNIQVAAPSEPLETVLERLRARPGYPVIVIDGGRPVGIITPARFAEFVGAGRR